MVALRKQRSIQALTAEYDPIADVLYVTLGEPQAAEGDGRPRGVAFDYTLRGGVPCGATVTGFKRYGWDQDMGGLARVIAEHLRLSAGEIARAIVVGIGREGR